MIIADLSYVQAVDAKHVEGGLVAFATSYTFGFNGVGSSTSYTDNTAISVPGYKFADSDSGSTAKGLVNVTRAGGLAFAA